MHGDDLLESEAIQCIWCVIIVGPKGTYSSYAGILLNISCKCFYTHVLHLRKDLSIYYKYKSGITYLGRA